MVMVPARKVPQLPGFMHSTTGIPQCKPASFKCRTYNINKGMFQIKTRAMGSLHQNLASSIVIISNFKDNPLALHLFTQN